MAWPLDFVLGLGRLFCLIGNTKKSSKIKRSFRCGFPLLAGIVGKMRWHLIQRGRLGTFRAVMADKDFV